MARGGGSATARLKHPDIAAAVRPPSSRVLLQKFRCRVTLPEIRKDQSLHVIERTIIPSETFAVSVQSIGTV